MILQNFTRQVTIQAEVLFNNLIYNPNIKISHITSLKILDNY